MPSFVHIRQATVDGHFLERHVCVPGGGTLGTGSRRLCLERFERASGWSSIWTTSLILELVRAHILDRGTARGRIGHSLVGP